MICPRFVQLADSPPQILVTKPRASQKTVSFANPDCFRTSTRTNQFESEWCIAREIAHPISRYACHKTTAVMCGGE